MLTGIFIVFIGLIYAYYAHGYGLGTLADPGSGFFPMVVAALLIVLGVSLLISNTKSKMQDPVLWKNILVVVTIVIVFAVLIETIGLVLTVFPISYITSAYANPGATIRYKIIASTAITVCSALIFKVLLDLPVNI